MRILVEHWLLFVALPMLAGLVAFGATYLIKPTFTARTMFLPPQQPQSAGGSTIASLSALSGLAGSLGAVKSPADQYLSLMHSVNVEDRIIDRFKLMQNYDVKYRFLAHKELETNIRTDLGKKDGLITVEVDADSPTLATDMANQYVVELRRLSGELALTEAQQRRLFFENQLKQTRSKLNEAQQVLSNSGFDAAALKSEPKAAAESYARLQADATAAEVRLRTLRHSLADASPEVQQQLAQYEALNAQLAKQASTQSTPGDAEYVGRYRDFKYQEALFELFSKQFEMARLDESREGGLIQIIDIATPPERKSKPHRLVIALGAAFALFVLLIPGILLRHSWRASRVGARSVDSQPRTDETSSRN